MNILITGARGFVGKNLAEALRNIQQKKDRTRPNLNIQNIYEYDLATAPALLEDYCKNADFVFNLAGVNRPKNNEEFMAGNFGFASTLDFLTEILSPDKQRCGTSFSEEGIGLFCGCNW